MRHRPLLLVAVGLALVVAVDLAGSRTDAFVDLTSDDTLSLTDETEEVVDALDDDIEVTAFLRRNEPGFAEARALLSRYRRLSRHISYRVLDPSSSPGEVRRLGVDPLVGAVAVERGDDVEVVATASEQDLTAAIARLIRGETPEVCATAGHGELDPEATDGEGLSGFTKLLADNGYRLRRVDLLARPEVPASCRALVVARPMTGLGRGGAVVARFLTAGGRALVLSDPLSTVDLSDVLAPWGLGLRRGIVFEGDPDSRFPDDPTRPIVTRYSSANPVVRKLPPIYLAGTQEVTVDDDADVDGLRLNRLADTSPVSYLETKPVEARFQPDEDHEGPITVMAAADRSRVQGDDIIRTRILVLGDADLATNSFLAEAGGSRLLIQGLDWLTLDENLVSVTANLPADRPLRLTDARLNYARFLSIAVIPGLFLLAGGVVWALRRSR